MEENENYFFFSLIPTVTRLGCKTLTVVDKYCCDRVCDIMGFKFKSNCIEYYSYCDDKYNSLKMEENSNSSEKSKSTPTNFSIERILLKSDTDTNVNKPKPLNKVMQNPWLSITPMSFKPKVVIQQQPQLRIGPSSSSSSSTSIVTPAPPAPSLFPQINPLYTSLLQQFPSASSFFHHTELYRDKLLPMTGMATNNNLISVNNYNYFFENHFKQVQNLTANMTPNQSYRSPSGSPLLSMNSAASLLNNNDNEINVKKLFLMQSNEGSSNGSGCSSLVGDMTSNLEDGLKCGICNKMFGCAETLEVVYKLFFEEKMGCQILQFFLRFPYLKIFLDFLLHL